MKPSHKRGGWINEYSERVNGIFTKDYQSAVYFVFPGLRGKYFMDCEVRNQTKSEISSLEPKGRTPSRTLDKTRILIFIHYFPADTLYILYYKNTIKWHMSDPVCANMACNIVANDILKKCISFVQGQAEQQDNLGGQMVTCLYSTVLYKSCSLLLFYVVFDLWACRNWFWFFFHVHYHSISCLNVKYPFPVLTSFC